MGDLIEALKAGRDALQKKLNAGMRTCAEDLEIEHHILQLDEAINVAEKGGDKGALFGSGNE